MKKIYSQIISEGVNGVASNCGDNNKGQNLAFVAEIEIYNQLRLFLEMLVMLKKLNKYCPNTCRDLNVESLIAKAEGCK
tara:strand:- start:7709 stop:7945 length:237 start_codon:yes stop_codon:yes gene_type:complete